MKKKFKARKKSKKISEKTGQGSNFRFNVNPLIKQELLQILKESKTPSENSDEQVNYTTWKNFDEPQDFTKGVKILAQELGIFTCFLSKYDI